MRFSGFSVKGPGKTRLYFSSGSGKRSSGKKKSSSGRSSGTPAGTKWRIGIGIFLLLGFFGGLSQEDYSFGLLAFCLVGGLVLLLWPLVQFGIEVLREKIEEKKPAAAPVTDPVTLDEHEMPDDAAEASPAFVYEDVGLYRPEGVCADMPALGDVLSFAFQPDNPYDAEAVYAVTSAGKNVGYMNKGKIRDFLNDALNNDWPCSATVTRADSKLAVSIKIEKIE